MASEKLTQALKQLKGEKVARKDYVKYASLTPDEQAIYKKANQEQMDKYTDQMLVDLCKKLKVDNKADATLLFYEQHREAFDFLNAWKNKAGWNRVCQALIGQPARDVKDMANADESLAKAKKTLEKTQARIQRLTQLKDRA